MNNTLGYLVSNYDEKKRLISIVNNSETELFYLTKTLNKVYSKTVKKGDMYISFEYQDKTKEIEGKVAKIITSIKQITHFDGENFNIKYSNMDEINHIKELISSLRYKMFIDFEFTMPGYGYKKAFTPEIIQIGAVFTDESDEIVNEYNAYVKSKAKISDRTINFLRLTTEDLDESIKQKQFYTDLKELVSIYKPVALTWGSSDQKSLQVFYKINKLEPLNIEFIDLSKLIKQYFGLSNDLSLFSALKIFRDIDASQAHHALTDAAATMDVFTGFKNIVINEINFDLKAKIKESKKKEE